MLKNSAELAAAAAAAWIISWIILRGCSSVPNVKRPMQKSSYVLRSYVGISKEMKIVENYEMKLNVLNSPGSPG